LTFLDFEKAFDSIEWSFIYKSLRYFNFGDDLINWIQTFYNGITSCVINNGHTSEHFLLERGVRQGCPLSPYLFIICTELLAHAIRNDQDITGLNIENVTVKMSLYADDTTVILKPDINEIRKLFYILDKFRDISGLTVNRDKTQLLRLGPCAKHKTVLCQQLKLTWTNGPERALGIILTSKAMFRSGI